MIEQDQKLKTLVMSRQNKLETDKANFNDRMQDVADYVSPYRDDIRGVLMKGERKGTKIYDGTAVGAAVLAKFAREGLEKLPDFYKKVIIPIGYLYPPRKKCRKI